MLWRQSGGFAFTRPSACGCYYYYYHYYYYLRRGAEGGEVVEDVASLICQAAFRLLLAKGAVERKGCLSLSDTHHVDRTCIACVCGGERGLNACV